MSRRRGTQGVNLAFWSGNEVYWKVRWETSIDGNGTPYRTMVCYKETWGGTPDPSASRNRHLARPALCRSRTGAGELADRNDVLRSTATGSDTITIPYDYSNLRFWRNTDVADLQPGQTYSLVQNLLGYEWDSDVENGFRPAGSHQSCRCPLYPWTPIWRITAQRSAPPMSPTA